MKKGNLFISCEEAKQICDKAQYGEASIYEKIKLHLRLSWCHITRGYSKRNVKLTAAVNKAHLNCLHHPEKEKIRQRLEKELADSK